MAAATPTAIFPGPSGPGPEEDYTSVGLKRRALIISCRPSSTYLCGDNGQEQSTSASNFIHTKLLNVRKSVGPRLITEEIWTRA
ncbi:hypothetical protein MTP99_009998 [Tenebrio molitor]|nr:hypothetical protein MTP99_009998 [Tenebrio molitor]